MSARGLTLTVLAMLGALVFGGGVAQARVVHDPLGVFGGGATPAGGFAPRGVAVDNSAGADRSDVYVVDTANHVVDQFGKSAGVEDYLSQITGTGVVNPAPAFSSPTGVAVDSTGNVWVADTGNGVLDELEPEAGGKYKYLTQLSESSIPLADRGNGVFGPGGVAVDSLGDVWVTDTANGVVDEFNSSGVFVSQLSESSIPPTNQGNGTFAPVGVATNTASPENVYAVDSSNGVVDVFSSSAGTDTFVSQLSNPTGSAPEAVTVDRSSNEVYVVYRDGEVVQYDSSGNVLSRFGPGSISPCTGFCEGLGAGPGVWGIGVESAGDVYVSNSYEWEIFGSLHRVNQVVSFAPATVPDATTEEPATSVTATSATVPGKVNPEGTSVAACEFEYGLEVTYGQTAPCAQEPSTLTGSVFLPVSAQLTGLEPSATYHYQLVASDASGNSENEGEDKQFTTPGMPPAVVSESAPVLTRGGATVEAKINPNNQETSYSLQYGASPTLAGATTVSGASALSGYSLEGVPIAPFEITGLAPNKVYYYRVLASNATSPPEKPTEGAIQSFTTRPPAPTAITGGASAVMAISATLAGAVNPGSTGPNSDTSYYFQYSTTETYSPGAVLSDVPVPSGDAGQGIREVLVSAGLEGLRPQTTYHYRLVAVNDHGEDPAYGEDKQFTTLASAPQALGPVILTETSALLELTVSPEAATAYKLEYGPSSSYGTSVSVPAGATLLVPELLSMELTGLQPGEIYHYRFDATSGTGTNYGPDETFETPFARQPETEPPPGYSLIGAALPQPAAAVYSDVFGVAPTPAANTTTTPSTPKSLTRAQKLAKALKACKRQAKKKRAACARQVRKKYATTKGKGSK
ncbi:MAG TPA: hypothetical protein VII53_09740 [Solirubrobacteraceae bacterium]